MNNNNCKVFVFFLRIPPVDNLSEHPANLQQWIKCMGKGWPPRVLHVIGLSNCRGEMQVFKHSTSEGSWPYSVSSFHLLENVDPAFHSWWADVNILIQCSCSLPESCLSASLFCEACQLLSQVFHARNFHAPLLTSLCRLEFHQHEKKNSSFRHHHTAFPGCVSVSDTLLVCAVAETSLWLVTPLTVLPFPYTPSPPRLLKRKGLWNPCSGNQYKLLHCCPCFTSVLLQIYPWQL